eukprot:COSAG02_NODE_4394_length_5412_cov_2.441558_5_plen_235_part_00
MRARSRSTVQQLTVRLAPQTRRLAACTNLHRCRSHPRACKHTWLDCLGRFLSASSVRTHSPGAPRPRAGVLRYGTCSTARPGAAASGKLLLFVRVRYRDGAWRRKRRRHGASGESLAMAMAGLLVAFAALAGPNPSNLLELECKLKHAACLHTFFSMMHRISCCSALLLHLIVVSDRCFLDGVLLLSLQSQVSHVSRFACSLLACNQMLIVGSSRSEQVRVVDAEAPTAAEPRP